VRSAGIAKASACSESMCPRRRGELRLTANTMSSFVGRDRSDRLARPMTWFQPPPVRYLGREESEESFSILAFAWRAVSRSSLRADHAWVHARAVPGIAALFALRAHGIPACFAAAASAGRTSRRWAHVGPATTRALPDAVRFWRGNTGWAVSDEPARAAAARRATSPTAR
jgi:hypothetical protein